MSWLTNLFKSRRHGVSLALVLGGLLVLGLWKFIGTVIPILLLLLAIILAWRRSFAGIAAALVAAAVLFWFGLALSWVFLAVGGVLIVGGVVALVGGRDPRIEETPKDA